MRERAAFRSADTLVYQFDWQRAFDPRIVVAVSRRGAAYEVATITYRLPPGLYAPADLQKPVLTVDSTSRPVSAEEWQAVERALDAARFWDLPRDAAEAAPSAPQQAARAEGADWTVRAVAGGRVHEVRRWSPVGGPDSLLVAAALGMVRLAGVHVEADRIY
jgi:hypothetical protein